MSFQFFPSCLRRWFGWGWVWCWGLSILSQLSLEDIALVRNVRNPAFNSFPVVSGVGVPAAPSQRALSILSQLSQAGVYTPMEQAEIAFNSFPVVSMGSARNVQVYRLRRSYFQFFPSCLRKLGITVAAVRSTFNSFPVVSGEWEDLLAELAETLFQFFPSCLSGLGAWNGFTLETFNSFPVVSGQRHTRGRRGASADFQFFPSCLGSWWSAPWSPSSTRSFQFFPSCLLRASGKLCPRCGVIFQFFPSCLLGTKEALDDAVNIELSILSQLSPPGLQT